MNKAQKILWLKKMHLQVWMSTWNEVFDELSRAQIVCICGKYASGMHERGCKKFINEVDTQTVVRLEYLIKEDGK